MDEKTRWFFGAGAYVCLSCSMNGSISSWHFRRRDPWVCNLPNPFIGKPRSEGAQSDRGAGCSGAGIPGPGALPLTPVSPFLVALGLSFICLPIVPACLPALWGEAQC